MGLEQQLKASFPLLCARSKVCVPSQGCSRTFTAPPGQDGAARPERPKDRRGREHNFHSSWAPGLNKQTKPQEQPNPSSALGTTCTEAPTRASELSQHKLIARSALTGTPPCPAGDTVTGPPGTGARMAQVPAGLDGRPGRAEAEKPRGSSRPAAAAQAGHGGVSTPCRAGRRGLPSSRAHPPSLPGLSPSGGGAGAAGDLLLPACLGGHGRGSQPPRPQRCRATPRAAGGAAGGSGRGAGPSPEEPKERRGMALRAKVWLGG